MNQTYSNIAKYILVLVVIAFIAWLFPNTVQSQFKYKIGDRWRYDNLVAPFDFSIKKSKDELNAEKQDITKEIYPFYLVDEKVADDQTSKFVKRFNQEVDVISPSEKPRDIVLRKAYYLDVGTLALNTSFERGVIDSKQTNAENQFINVVKNGRNQLTRLGKVPSIDEAQIGITDTIRSLNLSDGALLATLVQAYITPNVVFDEDLTDRYKTEAINRITTNKGAVLRGDLIVSRSELITKEIYDKINSYEIHYDAEVGNNARRWTVFAGYLILTSLIIGVFLLYLQFHATEVFQRYSSLAFMLMWPVLFSFLITMVEQVDNLSAYMIPFCVVPIVVKNFYSDRLALFTHIVIILIVSFLSREGYEFTFLQILAGIVTVLTVKETRFWNSFFLSILFIFLTYIFGYLGLELISKGVVMNMNWRPIVYFVIAGVLTLLAYPIIPLIEGVFGFTSSIKLAELADMNRPLLRDLSVKAPGTFQHSLQVANLGEAAADAIKANGLLVKTAALYHDIGKVSNPQFFIENLRGNSPHDNLNDKESAIKIIEHVAEGVKIAKKAKLPRLLIDFIKSHHGTTRTEYFYRNYVKSHPDDNVSSAAFQYPGPLPKSREEAVLMMADSLEAAAKSLTNPTGKDIDELVENIIRGKIEQNQLIEADISFKDLEACKTVFKSLLRSINHVRIEYPDEPTNKSASSI